MSSRKDYVATAAILNSEAEELLRTIDNTECAVMLARIIDAFAMLYGSENPRFDRQRFLAACGQQLVDAELPEEEYL